jgi:branched-chain amino acid transport system ATP-binding protein
VSIHVHAGEFVSVAGLNGAGKSTLFNALSGMLPYSGAVRREGASLRGQSAGTDAARRGSLPARRK